MSAARIPLVATAMFTLALLCGCGLIDPADDARIIVAESIDDVRLGDDTTAVIRKLGRPDYIGLGDFAGVIYDYTTGAHAGMSVSIWYVTPKGARSIGVSAPYTGTTRSGIGIGTTRSRVIEVLGVPYSTKDATHGEWTWEYHDFHSSRIKIGYVDSRVESITILR